MTGLELLLILIILYFGLRVNRIEERMNQMEKNFNKHLKHGSMEPSKTVAMGKPFECGTLSENFERVAEDFKKAKKDCKEKSLGEILRDSQDGNAAKTTEKEA